MNSFYKQIFSSVQFDEFQQMYPAVQPPIIIKMQNWLYHFQKFPSALYLPSFPPSTPYSEGC